MADLKNPTRIGDAYAQTFKIWIGRFKDSQKVVREFETREAQILRTAEDASKTPYERLAAISHIIRSSYEEEESHEGHDHG